MSEKSNVSNSSVRSSETNQGNIPKPFNEGARATQQPRQPKQPKR